MNNKIIIFAASAALLASFIFLSAVEMRQADPDKQNIWMLYFADPKSGSLDFTVENHSRGDNFHFEISADKTKVREGDIEVSTGATRTVPVQLDGTAGKKITVDVTGADGKKEIYKNF